MRTGRQSSLVLVTVDCLRADRVGFMGFDQPTTPFLDRLAGESLVFPKAIAVGAPTYYSFPGIMGSRFPLALGRDVVGIAPGEPTLASTLRASGYRTAAFVAANPYLSPRFGYEQGFELFRDFLGDGLGPAGGAPEGPRAMRTHLNEKLSAWAHAMGPLGKLYDELYFQYCQRIAAPGDVSWDQLRRFPAADVLVGHALEWIQSLAGEPFFLWLHFMDPHAPYYPPAEALAALGTGNLSPSRGRYLNAAWNRGDLDDEGLRRYADDVRLLHDAGIRWVDMQLERFVGTLQSHSLWDSAVFVLTADHGEEFLDHGGRFHPPSRLHQELLHVPLLVRVPGAPKKALSRAPFSHVHLAPTMLDAMAVIPPPEFEGGSRWSEVQCGGGWELALSESVGACTNPMDTTKRVGARMLAVQNERYKLVLDFDRGEEWMFDLDGDRGEQSPLPRDAQKAIRATLLRAALEHAQADPRSHDLSLRARVREVGLEWRHSKMPAEVPAS